MSNSRVIDEINSAIKNNTKIDINFLDNFSPDGNNDISIIRKMYIQYIDEKKNKNMFKISDETNLVNVKLAV